MEILLIKTNFIERHFGCTDATIILIKSILKQFEKLNGIKNSFKLKKWFFPNAFKWHMLVFFIDGYSNTKPLAFARQTYKVTGVCFRLGNLPTNT